MVHPSEHHMRSTAPIWDLPTLHYESAQKRSAQELNTQRSKVSLDQDDKINSNRDHIQKPDVCTRLFQDYYTRIKSRKERAEESSRSAAREVNSVERRTLLSPAISAEKQRLKQLQVQLEHEELSQALKQQREMDTERFAYFKLNSTRLYPPLKKVEPGCESYARALRELGDPRRNSMSINTLLSSQSADTLRLFIERVIELRDGQQDILKQITNCAAYDRFIEKQMTKEVLEQVMATIAKRLNSDQKTIVSNVKGPDFLPVQKWMQDEKARDKLIDSSLEEMRKFDHFEDLIVQRRQLASEKINLMLSLLQLLTRCDINMRSMFAEYRLGKFHVRKYDPSAVENVKQQEWFRDLGSTTSLRNNMKIRRSVRNVVHQVKKILCLQAPVPDVDNDPDRKLLEQVFNNKVINQCNGDRQNCQEDRTSSDEDSLSSSRSMA